MNGVPERLKTALADRYEIDRELGRGGMAIVYLAQDLRYNRQVAVKVLKPELAHALGADRFLREIQITAQLNHPYILPLLDSGETDGFLYYVMPYVAGESLRVRMDREGPLPIDEALRIAEEVASALEHAHSQEVIHRDIKPENILLHEGEAMVADFGIAVAVSVAGGERVTETGIAVGTPAFMSPEQASGDKAIDERSDIYSLGCVLYEMLGAEVPHKGSTPQEILAKKVLGEARSIRELRPEADEALEAVLARALEPVPEDRFATAGEFGEALRSPEVGWTIAAKRLKMRRQRVMAATAAGLVVLALVVGAVLQYAGGIEFLFRPAAAGFVDPKDCIVVAEFENETDKPGDGPTVRDAVFSVLSQSGYVSVLGNSRVRETLGLMRLPDTTYVDERLALEIAHRQNCPVVVSGKVASVGTGYSLTASIIETETGDEVVRLHQTAADETEVIGAIERLALQVRRHLGESLSSIRRSDRLARVTTNSLEALRKYTQGSRFANRFDFARAVPLLEDAIELDTAFAVAYRKLGVALGNMGVETQRTREAQAKAYEHRDRLTQPERYLAEASYYGTLGQIDEAVAVYATWREVDPQAGTPYINEGWYWNYLRQYARAEELTRRTWELGYPCELCYGNIAENQVAQEKFDEAEATLEQLSERHPDHGSLHSLFGRLASARGDYVGAETHFRRQREAQRGSLYWRANTSLRLAEIAEVRGQLAEAEHHLRGALETWEGWENRRNWPQYLRAALRLAELDLLYRGEADRALQTVEGALERYPLDSLAPLDRPYLDEFNNLGLFSGLVTFYAVAGQRERATALLDEFETRVDPQWRQPEEPYRHRAWGILALAEDRPDEAISELRFSDIGSNRIWALPYLGQAYELAGKPDSAIAVYERYVTTPGLYRLYVDSRFLAPILERLGSLYLEAGDTASAARHLSYFIELWKDADPELQPRVEAARRLLEQLATEGTP